MHSVIWVTNTDKVSLEKQLEPYDENTENPEYLTEHLVLKGTKKRLVAHLKDKIKITKESLKGLKYKRIKWYMRKDIFVLKCLLFWCKIKWKYALKRYAKREGYDINKKGDIVEYYNDNGRWDFYSIGGRYHHFYMLKNGEKANQFKLKNLSITKTIELAKEEADDYYLNEIQSAALEQRKPFFYNYDKTPTHDQYVKDHAHFRVPSAYVHNGNWVDCDDYTNWEDWVKHFNTWRKQISQSTLITVVDYHI